MRLDNKTQKKLWGASSGRTIGLFAPSGPFPPERFQAGLNLLKENGYRVKCPKILSQPQDYLAAPDELRLAGLLEMMADPEVDMLMAVRGGYGAMRILPPLENHWPQLPPKLIIGFSDITALHLARWQKTRALGLHGPVLTSLADLENPSSFFSFLENLSLDWIFTANSLLKQGSAKGRLIGGNLSLLVHLLASPYLPTRGPFILLLEDVGESPYKIDRLLTSLFLSPFIAKCRALVFGSFTDCGPPEQIKNIIQERTKNFSGPVVLDAPFGHSAKNNPWAVGAWAELS